MSAERIVMVSADGHAGAPISGYREYIEPAFREQLEELIPTDEDWRDHAISQSRFGREVLDVIDRDDTIASGGELGAWDVSRRLRELDREGVAAEVILPGHQIAVLPFFGIMNDPTTPAVRAAGARAYHRYLADTIAESDGRLYGIAEPGPCLDLDQSDSGTVAELRWVAEHGFVGVAPPGAIADPALPPLTSDYYEPFWSACEELGLVLNVHAGWGLGQVGNFTKMLEEVTDGLSPEEFLSRQMTADVSIDKFPKDSPQRLALIKPRRPLWQFMTSGVFDRHPNLRLVLTEIRADWVPATLAVLDRYFAARPGTLKKTPSEYWAQHCYVAPSSPRPYEIALRHEIGVERLMFGMDYPHPEGTWPNTREWLRLTLGDVPEDEIRRFLGLNTIDCYRLDRERIERTAQRIGLLPSDILGRQGEITEALIDQFHARSGFRRPAEHVDDAVYEEMIREDSVPASAAS